MQSDICNDRCEAICAGAEEPKINGVQSDICNCLMQAKLVSGALARKSTECSPISATAHRGAHWPPCVAPKINGVQSDICNTLEDV